MSYYRFHRQINYNFTYLYIGVLERLEPTSVFIQSYEFSKFYLFEPIESQIGLTLVFQIRFIVAEKLTTALVRCFKKSL